MNRRQFARHVGLGVGGLAAALGRRVAAGADAQRPNIMLVIADDMTWIDCEPYGSKDVQTPNMARLAREGLCFDAMFTSTAMCAPTRQQLYTGMYPVRNGAYPNHSRVYDGVRSLPHHLKALGYRVGLIGKRHFGPAASFPFETTGGQGDKEGADDTAAIAEFVNRSAEQPYCLIVCSNEPHGPWNKGDPSAYDPDQLTVPPYLVDCPETRRQLPKYYAEITYLDRQLGDCMKVVDESGRTEDTMVIFTSEQGQGFPSQGKWTCYDTGLKTATILRWPAVVEPGTRTTALTQYVDVVPTLIEAAGGDPGSIDTGRPDANGDTGFDGRSFLSVLLGEAQRHRDYVYGAHTTRGIINGSACYPIRSVRSDRYKYIRNLNHTAVFYNVVSTRDTGLLQAWIRLGGQDPAIAERVRLYQHRPAEELYDIERDPFELENLAGDPAHAAVKDELSRELDRWMQQQGDEGNETELCATERQGPRGDTWKPYEPGE
jgi:N-sulfoglucosamine sulfohydrolase